MKTQNQIQFITIDYDYAGQRIDNFLLTRLKGVPRNMIYRIIRRGEVRINSCRVKPKYKIKTSDIVRIPAIRQEEKQQNIILSNKIIMLTKHIIYEDEYLLVLNKPSGIVVHGSNKINLGVIEILRILRPEIRFLELVHRIDRETSGILLIAKKRSILKELHQQLRLKQMQKQYIALVKGQWPAHVKVVQVPLLRKVLENGKRIEKVSINGKYSETHFKIEECFANATLVKVIPKTGRTHQIRVHAQYIKHPIAYDKRYGDFSFNQQLVYTGLKRLFLHASSLMFIHPASRKEITFNASLDQQLKNCLTKLRSSTI